MDKFNNKPLVSVIMPAYNAEKYIGQAIESIINQTYKNWELLIADDGSSDQTRKIIDKFAEIESRIKVYHNQLNIGYLKTSNKLFKLCSGDLITFQDADDICAIKRIEKQVSFLKNNPNIVLTGTGTAYFINNAAKFKKIKRIVCSHNEILDNLKKQNQFCGASVMFRKRLFDDIGFYLEFFDRIGSEDYDYFFRAANIHQVANMPDVLYFARLNEVSFSRGFKPPKTLISADLVRFLAEQRANYGKDSLTGLDLSLLDNYQSKLLSRFSKDKSLVYRVNADFSAYGNYNKQVIYYSFKAILSAPFKIINFKYFFSALFKFIFKGKNPDQGELAI